MLRMVKYSYNTGLLTGTAPINIQIPGSYNGLVRLPIGSNGRLFVSAEIFCANPLPGDYLSGVTVEDTDGVIPAGVRPALPNYPSVSLWADPALGASNVGIFLSPLKSTLLTPLSNNPFCPSGLYLKATFQKASIGVDTVYLNIIWDDLI
jgi:hypothetical protein